MKPQNYFKFPFRRDELASMVKMYRESPEPSRTSTSPAPKKAKLKLSRTKSDMVPTKPHRETNKESKSQSRLSAVFEESPSFFLERQIGDTAESERSDNGNGTSDILKIFMTKRKPQTAQTTFDDAMSFGDS